jgi:CRISPR/Cas system CSM-associated protein Csm3 (group 7 of RAMP superfamily)
MTLKYQIEFFTYWHAGSGLSGGAYADLLVNKNKAGLPFLPGKTLKGMIRDGALMLNEYNPRLVTTDFIHTIFGEVPTKVKLEDADTTPVAPGICFFSNAELSAELTAELTTPLNPDEYLGQYLYEVLSSTKIDENGLAEDHTLRQMEVTIPLTLYATIEDFPDDEDSRTQMQHCLSAIKRMGLGRTRGLGRCQFSLLNQEP